ncbi:MAG: hypothetical protein EBZ36_04485 [Acidobacteria bacterium]|nr:hypothetical protein [Acidobacteriota bacterium]
MERVTFNRIAAVGVALLFIIGSTITGEGGSHYRASQTGRTRLVGQIRAYEIGERNGYECGLREAREDRRRNNRYNDAIRFSFRDNRWGYLRQYGLEDDYRNGFRRGYAAGYRAGFSLNRR